MRCKVHKSVHELVWGKLVPPNHLSAPSFVLSDIFAFRQISFIEFSHLYILEIFLAANRASRQVPPGQLPPGQVPLWTGSILDKFPPDKFPFGQVPPGQVPLEGKHLKRTSSPRTTYPRTRSTSDKFPPGGSCPGGSCLGGTCLLAGRGGKRTLCRQLTCTREDTVDSCGFSSVSNMSKYDIVPVQTQTFTQLSVAVAGFIINFQNKQLIRPINYTALALHASSAIILSDQMCPQ